MTDQPKAGQSCDVCSGVGRVPWRIGERERLRDYPVQPMKDCSACRGTGRL